MPESGECQLAGFLGTGPNNMATMLAEMTFNEFDIYFDKKLNGFATKDYLDQKLKGFATKDDLKSFATKDDLDQKLNGFATKDDLKGFATKDDLQSLERSLEQKMYYKFDEVHLRMSNMQRGLEFKIDQIDYKIDTSIDEMAKSFDEIAKSFDELNRNSSKLEDQVSEHGKKICELDKFTSNHAMRLKKLELKTS